jgi:hypothetical protein
MSVRICFYICSLVFYMLTAPVMAQSYIGKGKTRDVTTFAYVGDPQYQSGPICSTSQDVPFTKGTITIGGPPIAGRGIKAGQSLGISGVGHTASGITYVKIYPMPFGQSAGWVPLSALSCKGNIASGNLKRSQPIKAGQ